MSEFSNMQFQTALAHYLAGRLSEAEKLYRQVLETDARHSHALSMLGMILMDQKLVAEAESIFLRHLDMEPENPLTLHNLGRLLQSRGKDKEAVALFRRAGEGKPDIAPIFNDLAVSLHRLGQCDEALLALDKALAIDPDFGLAHDNRGVVLYDCRRFEEAVQAHLKALFHTSVDDPSQKISVLLNLSRSLYEMADLLFAEQTCRAILEIDANHEDATEHLAKVMYRLHRDNDALSLLNRLARKQGVLQKEHPESPEATILVLGGVGASHVPTRCLFDPALFAKLTLIMLSPDQHDAPLGAVKLNDIAEANLIFNTLGEVEKNGGQFDAVTNLSAQLGIPLINPPDRVARTGRDCAQKLFGDIPGLIVPEVRKMSREELAYLPIFTRPLLIRPAGTHGGDDLSLISTRADLREYLKKTPCEQFFLIDFYDYRSEGNCYRKYRFIFIDRQPYPYHLAIANNWLVHYWRADMGCFDWKMQEEKEFLTDWSQVFSPRAVAAVKEVGQRMDLDYGGLDCSILDSGEVIFFEANACMLVHIDNIGDDFSYKHQAVSCIRDAVTNMIRKRLSQEMSK